MNNEEYEILKGYIIDDIRKVNDKIVTLNYEIEDLNEELRILEEKTKNSND